MGMTIFDDPELGKVNAPNLTSGLGGIGSAYSDEDWVRVLRNGVKPNGKGVFVMPSKDFHAMGEDDLGSLIAYMKAVPPVDKEWERESQLTVFAKVLLALGAFGDVISAENINHTAMAELSPTPAPTGEYGNYIVRIFGSNLPRSKSEREQRSESCRTFCTESDRGRSVGKMET